jgi:hypothetical protein
MMEVKRAVSALDIRAYGTRKGGHTATLTHAPPNHTLPSEGHVMKLRTFPLMIATGLLSLLWMTRPVAAYDTATHVGLTERAAQASDLATLLSDHWGCPLGTDEPLGPLAEPWRGRALRLDPDGGVVPDERDPQSRQSALALLLAGAALEGSPAARTRNHYYDPNTRRGLVVRGTLLRMFFSLFGDREIGGSLGDGVAAPDWAVAQGNDLALSATLDALERSASAATPDERKRALGRALVGIGALMHLVEDMAAPAHVRDDFDGAMTRVPGSSVWDRRSPYEYYVERRFGRLGVPAPAKGQTIPALPHLRDYFVTLAEWVAPRFFSSGTLPAPVAGAEGQAPAEMLERAGRGLARPQPQVPPPAIGGMVGTGGDVLASEDVPALAVYTIDPRDQSMAITLDPRTHAAYAQVLLPRAVLWAAGVLRFVARGRLAWVDGNLHNRGPQLANGAVTVLTEDSQGTRRTLAGAIAFPAAPVAPGGAIGHLAVPLPPGTKRLIAVFRGTDGAGEPLVAIEDVAAPAPSSEPAQNPTPDASM